MMTVVADEFRVGNVLIAGTFTVSPADAAVYFHNRRLAARLALPGFSPNLESSGEGNLCPLALIVDGAVGALRSAMRLRGYQMKVCAMGDARQLAAPIVGEPMTCCATMRYSRQRGGELFLTLEVEVRRSRGGTLARFELGVELGQPRPRMSYRGSRLYAA